MRVSVYVSFALLLQIPLPLIGAQSNLRSPKVVIRKFPNCTEKVFSEQKAIPIAGFEFPFPNSEKLLDGNGEFVGDDGSILAYMTMDRRGQKTLHRFDINGHRHFEPLYLSGMERLTAVENGNLLVAGLDRKSYFGTWVDPRSGAILGHARFNPSIFSFRKIFGNSLGLFQIVEKNEDQSRLFQSLRLVEDSKNQEFLSVTKVPYFAPQSNQFKGIQGVMILEQDRKHLFATSFSGKRLWKIDVDKNLVVSHAEVSGDELYVLAWRDGRPRRKLLAVLSLETSKVLRYVRTQPRMFNFRIHPHGQLIALGTAKMLKVQLLTQMDWQQPHSSLLTLLETFKALPQQ